MGVEWELLPIDDRGRMVSYFGPTGVEAALSRCALRTCPSWKRGISRPSTCRGAGWSGSEPGGQVELASPPRDRLAPIRSFLEDNLHGMEDAAGPGSFRLKAWGVAPQNGEEDLPDVPKARYGILREHLLRAAAWGGG